MSVLSGLALLLLTGCAAPPPDSTMTLFDFQDGIEGWTVVNDGIMGGRSEGHVEADGAALVFTGTVVTEGGGFTSVEGPRRVDLSDYDGVELRVRGGGRTFELEVHDGSSIRGREVSRRAPFPTTDAWATVRVPFDRLEASVHGDPVDASPLDLAGVERLTLFIIDGQDGPFRLEVDWMRAYRDDA